MVRGKSRLFLIVLIASLSFISISGLSTICIETPSEFDTYCSANNGFPALGRCFIAVKFGSWDLGFSNCQELNLDFAQILSEAENAAFAKHHFGATATEYWFAMKRDHPNIGGQSTALDDTYFFSDPINHTSNLMATDTWAKTHQNDDTASSESELCFNLHTKDKFAGSLVDADCSNYYAHICSLTNLHQVFVEIPDKIIDTGVVGTLPIEDAEQCATACANNIQCRGFNMVANRESFECQLVSWNYDDFATPTSAPGSSHYKFMQ